MLFGFGFMGKTNLKNTGKMLIYANEPDDVNVNAINYTTKRSAV